MSNTRISLGKVANIELFTFLQDRSAFAYDTGMAIDADGAYHAYHPDNVSGLDYLANAGKPGNWFGVVTDTGSATGHPVVQGLNDPAPGFYVSETSFTNATVKDPKNPKKYVEATQIPYIVLPRAAKNGAKLGDLCIVYNPLHDKLSGGIYADSGPADSLGEASIAMATALGIPNSPKHGGQGAGVAYLVFPGTSIGFPKSNEAIQTAALQLFIKWGGMDRLKILLPTFQL